MAGVIGLAFMVSCGGSTTNADRMAQFDELMRRGDIPAAREVGREMYQQIINDNDSSLTVNQLCDLALSFMTMSEGDDATLQDEDVAIAKTLYRNALELSADSVVGFSSGLVNEDAGAWMLLVQLSGMDGMQLRIDEFSEPDSLQWQTDSI